MRTICRLMAILSMAFGVSTVPALSQVSLSGSIQSDILIPQDDDKIGTEHYSDWGLTNTYTFL